MSPDHVKPSNLEDDYFAREEIEQKRRLALKQSEVTAAKQREELKQLHFMKCPKCGFDLHSLEKGKVELDTCFNCKGVWLDEGELQALLKTDEQSGSWTRAVLNLFKTK
jgi:predicted Zn-ribbon and HTH transcriptional regulator